MTLATSPTHRLTVSARDSLAISVRWREWLGPVHLHWHGHAPLGLERSHFEWMADLMARGIPMRSIRRHSLDDPREPRLVLMARAQMYTERSARRRSVIHAHQS